MPERSFLIQRYCFDQWPHVLGHRPFIVSGPSLTQWVVPGSFERLGRWMLRPEIRTLLDSLFPQGGIHRRHYQRDAVSESMLREGVLQALWSVGSGECLPAEERWDESIRQVARELPFLYPESFSQGDGFWETADAVSELLSGIPSPEMARSYLSEDRLPLEPVVIP